MKKRKLKGVNKSKKELQLIKYIKSNKKYSNEIKKILLTHSDKVYIWPSSIEDGFSCNICGSLPTSNWIEPTDYNLNTIINHLEKIH
tara:strand:- start:526 stop:786 length:261 start_codon:yes stop_codon:yes gene_type:complete